MDRSPKLVTEANSFLVHLGASLLGGWLVTTTVTGAIFITVMVLDNLIKLPMVDFIPELLIPLIFLVSTGLIQRRHIARLEAEYLAILSVIGFTMTGALSGLFIAVAFNGGLLIVIQWTLSALAISLLSSWAFWHQHQRSIITVSEEEENG